MNKAQIAFFKRNKCPYCGSKVYLNNSFIKGTGRIYYSVHCYNCTYPGEADLFSSSIDGAISAWREMKKFTKAFNKKYVSQLKPCSCGGKVTINPNILTGINDVSEFFADVSCPDCDKFKCSLIFPDLDSAYHSVITLWNNQFQ